MSISRKLALAALALTLLTVHPSSAMPFGFVLSTKTATQDGATPLGVVPGVGSVPAPVVTITFSENIVGQNTNTRRIHVVEVQNGTPIAIVAEIQFNAGTNASANVPFVVPNINSKVQAGDMLVAVSQHIGSGIPQPSATADLTY